MPAAWVHHPPLPPARGHIAGMGEQQTAFRCASRLSAQPHMLYFPLVPKRIELWPVKWVAWRLCLLQQAFCLTFVDSLELPFFPLAQQQCATLTPHTHTHARVVIHSLMPHIHSCTLQPASSWSRRSLASAHPKRAHYATSELLNLRFITPRPVGGGWRPFKPGTS